MGDGSIRTAIAKWPQDPAPPLSSGPATLSLPRRASLPLAALRRGLPMGADWIDVVLEWPTMRLLRDVRRLEKMRCAAVAQTRCIGLAGLELMSSAINASAHAACDFCRSVATLA